MSQERVIATLGLAANTLVPSANPALDPALMKKSLAVHQLLIKTTEMFAGLGGKNTDAVLQAIYGEVAASFAILLQGGGTLITDTTVDQVLVANLVKAAAQRVAAAPAVDSEVRNALAALNAESLGVVSAGGLKAQTEHILKAADSALTAAATASQTDPTITACQLGNTMTMAKPAMAMRLNTSSARLVPMQSPQLLPI